MKTCIDCGSEFGTTRSRSPRCETCRKKHHQDQCRNWNNTPEGKRCVRNAQKKYQSAHPDRVRASHYKWAEKNREYYLAQKRENSRQRTKRKKAAVTPSQWMEKREAQMQYCDRIKVRMLHLPCGLREECFLLPKCPKCLAENPPKREPFSIAV